jgi:hypothetical protein
MADPHSSHIAGLNEFGLPRHGDGVGPTLRPDIIAERHRHDWDQPATEPLAFAAGSEALQVETDFGAQLMADDRLHRSRTVALAPTAADFGDTAFTDAPGGDNEQQCARRAHAQAQAGEGSSEGA